MSIWAKRNFQSFHKDEACMERTTELGNLMTLASPLYPEGPSPQNQVRGFWVIVTIVKDLGKYMIMRYLDP